MAACVVVDAAVVVGYGGSHWAVRAGSCGASGADVGAGAGVGLEGDGFVIGWLFLALVLGVVAAFLVRDFWTALGVGLVLMVVFIVAEVVAGREGKNDE